MSGPIFARLEPGYAKLWAELEVAPEHAAAVKAICAHQLAHKAIFQQVEHATGVPWWWVLVTDQMEGGGGASTFLGNGQSLARVTTEVPAGQGPFANFVAGAVRAIHLDGVDAPATWSVEYAAFRWEGFNGWGYLHLAIEDPYLAAWSNKESPGKYTSDHHFDPTARSEQPGALTILKVLVGLDPTILQPSAPPSPTPTQGDFTVNPMTVITIMSQLFTIMPKVVQAVQTIMNSDAGHTIESAIAELIGHNTPGQPNSAALGPTAKG